MKHHAQTKTITLAGIGLLAAVFLAVGSFGGTERITWGVVEAVVLLLALFLLLSRAIELRRENAGRFLAPAALIVFLGVGYGLAARGGLIADRWAAGEEWLRLACFLCAFYVTLAVARTAEARRRFAAALVVLGLGEALYGMVQYLTGWQRIFTYVKKYYLEEATGTYINHNHFAGLLEMVLPLGVALASYHLERAIRGGGGQPPRSLAELFGRAPMHKSLLLAFVSLLLAVAVVFSRSRMGLLSCVVSLLVMAALAATRKGSRALCAAVVLVLLAAGMGFTFWIGMEPIVSRFAILPTQEFSHPQEGGRLAVWRDTSHLLRQHPWLGVGPGGFETAYTQFQTVHLDFTVDHAHNDYLELAAELGLPGAALLFGMILAVAARTLRGFWAHHDSSDRALSLGVFAGIVALLLHSLADFNLYIPANGLVFAVLLGLGASLAAPLPAGASSPRAAD